MDDARERCNPEWIMKEMDGYPHALRGMQEKYIRGYADWVYDIPQIDDIRYFFNMLCVYGVRRKDNPEEMEYWAAFSGDRLQGMFHRTLDEAKIAGLAILSDHLRKMADAIDIEKEKIK